jgi:hypothetical protein
LSEAAHAAQFVMASAAKQSRNPQTKKNLDCLVARAPRHDVPELRKALRHPPRREADAVVRDDHIRLSAANDQLRQFTRLRNIGRVFS